MIDQELQFDVSTLVQHQDQDGLVPTSATLTLNRPDGTSLQAPSVTLPALSTTLQAGSTALVLILGSVTGLQRGDLLRVTTAGYDYVVEAALINGTTKAVTLLVGLPVLPTVGDAVKNLKMSATCTAPGAGAIGGDYRLVWSYQDGTTTKQVGVPAAVVRWPWTSPVSAKDVRDIVAELGGGNRSETWCQDVADQVDQAIRGKINQTGRRPSLYLSGRLFQDVSRTGIRYELAQRGMCFGGNVAEAQRELRFAFDDKMAQVIQGLSAYDQNQDGRLDSQERKPVGSSVRARR